MYLKAFVVDAKVGEELFGALGPLSSFSQRTAMARAYGYISRKRYDDLTLIRQVRNHFAHHPLDATFASPKVATLCIKLSEFATAKQESETQTEAHINRTAFLLSCVMFCGSAHHRMEEHVKQKAVKPAKASSPES